MVEERTTEVETPSGNTHTHTTVVSDGERYVYVQRGKDGEIYSIHAPGVSALVAPVDVGGTVAYIAIAWLVIGGLGLWTGVFPGNAPFPLTALPAILATIVLLLGLLDGRLALRENANHSSRRRGFVDQAHFTTTFRRSFDITPGRYRRSVRAAPSVGTVA